MPVLENARHERLAQLLAEGKPRAQAYVEAGYAPKAASASVCKLLKSRPEILQRRDEILLARRRAEERVAERALDRAGWDRAKILSTLVEVVERCMQARPVLNRKGEPVMCETPDGSLAPAYRFDARGAVAALRLLGLEQGMFIERHEVHHRSPLDAIPPELQRVIRARLQAALEQRGWRVIEGNVVRAEVEAVREEKGQ